MSRIVSVYLPRWPILRMLAAQAKRRCEQPIAPDQPFVLTVASSGGPRIAALNEAAENLGLTIGEPLADARARAGFLQVRTVEPAIDDTALRKLALWATRYTPTASPWDEDNGADGFFLDVEGASHLFGGEEKLIADLAARLLKNFSLPARIAVANTAGAAWALSRFHSASLFVLPPGHEIAALAPLPIAALRLAPNTRVTLRRLGFKTASSLLDQPRAPFAARFPHELLRRLDQALGRIDEPLKPVVAPPVYHALRYLIEPIFSRQAIVAYAKRLMGTLTHVLIRDDIGARRLRLSLYNVDGAVETVDIALTLPTRSIDHVARLIELKLEALAGAHEAGFGFETIGLAITETGPMSAQQTEFVPVDENDNRTERCAGLIDALRQRLGPQSVRCFEPIESHIPERAETMPFVATARPRAGGDPVLDSRLRGNVQGKTEQKTTEWPEPDKPRPLLLLPRAELAKVTALVPDGPPRRFFWRGETHEVTDAEGPERIAGEWWQHRMYEPTRDYYVVEDSSGQRFWLYREGIYGRETAQASWFVHGLFA
jgi:protein ImuB